MSRIFISGSSTGLGLMAADLLVSQGHHVVLHARNASRAENARRALPKSEAVVTGDLDLLAIDTNELEIEVLTPRLLVERLAAS